MAGGQSGVPLRPTRTFKSIKTSENGTSVWCGVGGGSLNNVHRTGSTLSVCFEDKLKEEGLTELAHFEDLTQHLGQLDAAAAKRTLVLVFSTAVLQDDLEINTNERSTLLQQFPSRELYFL